ncbi:MAG: hypothetical protein H6841_07925 [Planctomycetes bacterium]|nr:hypothetical protein [Planctomycetota bacterium]MCB9935477.1 hypothetical protein [Planctomycetota bacterium]
MSRHRPVGNRGREQRKARSSSKLLEGLAIVQRLYLETGGDDIDFGIRSAKLMLQIYQEECEGNPREGMEPVTHDQANRARQQLASFTRQRERKLAELKKLVDEGDQEEADRSADAERNADVPSAETPLTDASTETFDTESAFDADQRSALRTDPAFDADQRSALRTDPAHDADQGSALRTDPAHDADQGSALRAAKQAG